MALRFVRVPRPLKRAPPFTYRNAAPHRPVSTSMVGTQRFPLRHRSRHRESRPPLLSVRLVALWQAPEGCKQPYPVANCPPYCGHRAVDLYDLTLTYDTPARAIGPKAGSTN
jgi:hypothetical protein